VLERLQNRQLKIYDCCTNLLNEAAEYHYEPGGDGRIGKLPAPINDHALDALRYLIVGVDFGRELALQHGDFAGPTLQPASACVNVPGGAGANGAGALPTVFAPADAERPADHGAGDLADLIWGQ
ncbi:MAG: hypothetical protein HKL95_03960, partial [Phycisphaerae bacterium]|nr:hypothetical protein [Phycisphaerae bacterium]